jgi:hypothetical protein
MNEHPTDPSPPQKKRLSAEQRAALQSLRAARGEQQASRLKAHVARNRQLKRAVREYLAKQPATVP